MDDEQECIIITKIGLDVSIQQGDVSLKIYGHTMKTANLKVYKFIMKQAL